MKNRNVAAPNPALLASPPTTWSADWMSKFNRTLSGQLTQIMATAVAPVTWRAYGGLTGKPSSGQVLFSIELTGDEQFPNGLPQNLGGCTTPPSGNVVFPILVNGVQVGSMNIAASSTAATWTMAADYFAAPQDILSFLAPSPQDGSLAGPYYTFVGTHG